MWGGRAELLESALGTGHAVGIWAAQGDSGAWGGGRGSREQQEGDGLCGQMDLRSRDVLPLSSWVTLGNFHSEPWASHL